MNKKFDDLLEDDLACFLCALIAAVMFFGTLTVVLGADATAHHRDQGQLDSRAGDVDDGGDVIGNGVGGDGEGAKGGN